MLGMATLNTTVSLLLSVTDIFVLFIESGNNGIILLGRPSASLRSLRGMALDNGQRV